MRMKTRVVRPRYTFMGYIPELNYILLRNSRTGKIEAWAQSRGVAPITSILFQGKELEFVREINRAYRIPDTDHNRRRAFDEIGRIFLDQPPRKAYAVEIT